MTDALTTAKNQAWDETEALRKAADKKKKKKKKLEWDAPVNFIKDFTEVFNARNSKFAHDRTKSVGASEVFGCLRENWYKNNIPRSHIEDWGFMERGNVIEDHFVVPFLVERFGEENCVGVGQKNQITLSYGNNTATPDALIVNQAEDVLASYDVESIGNTGHMLVEAKSFDDRTDLRTEKAIHKGQIITQMGLFRETTEYAPSWGVVLYVNSSDFKDMRVFPVEFSPPIFKRAQKRADAVIRATAPEELRAEGAVIGTCHLCDYADQCADANLRLYAGENEKDVIDEQTLDNAREHVAEFIKIKDLADKYDKLKKEKQHEIKELLAQEKRKSIIADGIVISHSKINGKMSLDLDSMRADGIDVDQYMKQGRPFFRLHVKQNVVKK